MLAQRSFRILLASAFFAGLLCSPGRLAAQTDYLWQDATSGGLWSTAANWSPSGPASDSTNAADFSTLKLTANNTIHLDVPETIGGLTFGDQGNAFSWTLDDNAAGNILTLAAASTPTITVNNQTATIEAGITGTQGFTKLGTGTLALSGNNTFSGLTINAGAVAAAPSPSTSTPLGAGAVTLAGANTVLKLQGQIGVSGSWTVTDSGMLAQYYSGATVASNTGGNVLGPGGNSGTSASITYNPYFMQLANVTAAFGNTFGAATITPDAQVNASTMSDGTPLTTFAPGTGSSSAIYLPVPTYTGNVYPTGQEPQNSKADYTGAAGGTTIAPKQMAAIFTGLFNAPTAGVYTFSMVSNSGVMYIDPSTTDGGANMLPLINDSAMRGGGIGGGGFGNNALQFVSSITLSAGLHPVEFIEEGDSGGNILTAQVVQGVASVLTGTNIPVIGTNDVPLLQTSSFTNNVDTTDMGFVQGTFAPSSGTQLAPTQSYANNLVVNANSSVDVSGSLAATVGPLAIGAPGSSTTLGVTSADTSGNAYSLTVGATTLAGNATFNVAASTGTGSNHGAGTLSLGAITDNGSNFSITKTGPGTLTLTAANSFGGGLIIGTGTPGSGGTVLAAPATLGPAGQTQLGTGPVTLAGGTLVLQGQTQQTAGLNGTYYSFTTGKPGNLTLIQNAAGTSTSGGFTYPRSSFIDSMADINQFVGNLSGTDNSGAAYAATQVNSTPISSSFQSSGTALSNFQFNATSLTSNGAPTGPYLVVWTGQFNAPTAGMYNFELASYDGSTFYIDQNPLNNSYLGANALNDPNYTLLADNNMSFPVSVGTNSPNASLTGGQYHTGSLLLSAGLHSVVLSFWEQSNVGGPVLALGAVEGSGTVSESSFTSALAQTTDPTQLGFSSLGGAGTTQNYTNNITVTANSTIDITNVLSATLGTLQIGAASGNTTLQIISTDPSQAAYNLTLGATTLTGNATFDVENNATGIGTLALGAVGQTGGNFSLTKTGPGTLMLTAPGTYSGGTIITAGIVNISSDSALGATSGGITFNGSAAAAGTLQLATGFSDTLIASSRGISVSAGDTGILDTNGNSPITYGGTLTVGASGSFVKAGAGIFEIDAAPSLAAGSVLGVSGGTLRLNYSGAATIGAGATASIASGATLQLAGSASQLSQSVNVTNSGSLSVTGGSQVVGTITGGSGTVAVSSGSLTAYKIVQNSLTIGSGATVTLAPSGSGSTTNPSGPNNINFSSTLNSLTIAGTTGAWTGTLDIGNNGLVIEYGTAANDPYTTIDNMIETGFDAAHWDGQGITSSLGRVAANSHTPLNIGLEDFTPGKGNFSNTTFIVFEGQTVTTNAILIRLTYMDDIVTAGDLNAQDASSDALIFAANYGTGTTWSVGDLEHTGLVGSADALLFAANYTPPLASLDGTTGGAVALAGSEAAVPEPGSVALAAIGAAGLILLIRRRRGG